MMEMQVTIPPNTTAEIRLPGAAAETATESSVPLRTAVGVVSASESGGNLILAAGSGNYTFIW